MCSFRATLNDRHLDRTLVRDVFGSWKKGSVKDSVDEDSSFGSGSALLCTSRRRRTWKGDYRYPKVSGWPIVKDPIPTDLLEVVSTDGRATVTHCRLTTTSILLL